MSNINGMTVAPQPASDCICKIGFVFDYE